MRILSRGGESARGSKIHYVREPLIDGLRDFDVVLDSSFDKETMLLVALKRNAGASYVTFTSPLVKMIDELGLKLGREKADEMLAVR